ncbi:464_t:CDS:1, partial [Racocetra persica]
DSTGQKYKTLKLDIMTQLRQIDNQQLLQELQNRLHNRQLSEQEVVALLEAEQ